VKPLVSIALACVVAIGCKPVVATADECAKVSDHLGDLQVKKERIAPMGRLSVAPFNGPENEKAIFEEARDSAKKRCAKGWKREIYECMMTAADIETADKCRMK
jgi:hypothetical protein